MWRKVKNWYRLVEALASNLFYGSPGRRLTVIGVTGTDGKTTTVNLIYHILRTAGLDASVISTVGAIIGGKAYSLDFHVTTPSASKLQQFIKDASGYLVLEVTSHAIDQNRIWGIPISIAVLTNITPEHLDYHKHYDSYLKTKVKFLKVAKTIILNKDDRSFKTIGKLLNGKYKGEILTYALDDVADFTLVNSPFRTKIQGEFNQHNFLAAIAVCKKLGIKEETIKKGMETFKLPIGRMEKVYKNNFMVMIDFAHTPNALVQILSTVKPTVKGRLIHVFGSAGQRDSQKRIEMGRVSDRYADVIILTAEDPRNESVDEIISQIAKGIKGKKNVFKIPNRQEAIDKAIEIAKKGDLIILTGKGHEKSMNYGDGEEQWSEHEAVKKALKKRHG